MPSTTLSCLRRAASIMTDPIHHHINTPLSTSTHRISSLPLPPPSQRLQSLLTPTPSNSSSFLSTLQSTPSTQRRSTTFSSGHFTNVTPLPIGFPYRLPSKLDDEGNRVASIGVEEWLSSQEPLDVLRGPKEEAELALYGSKTGRAFPTVLLALSPTCLDHVLPHLDAGDSLELVQKLLPSNLTEGEDSSNEARDELVGVLGGREVIMTLDGDGEGRQGRGYKPWSLRYGGRQFGSWASQLGDGRAISLLETVTPSGEIQEIQIKGAGRTPFSRHADGLAVLRSSIREFLGAENAAAFPSNSLPTSRSLSLTLLPTLEVMREYGPEPGAIASRIAPSFLRIGSFEILNPPQNEFLFSFAMMSGGKMPEKVIEWENLRILAELVQAKLFGFGRVDGGGGSEAKGAWEMVREIARRNARMVAGWQAWGFMHGVINTDNVSVLGLTIDYGPYAYMDAFDRNHICNHSDETGRYSYAAQPEMVYFAMNALLQATAELIGYESTHSSSSPTPAGWATDVPSSDLKAWRAAALAQEPQLREEFFAVFQHEYRQLMGRRLGLPGGESTEKDERELIEPFLDLLERHSLDFHSSFRSLCAFDPTSSASDFTSSIDKTSQQLLSSAKACSPTAAKEVEAWLEKYAARLVGKTAAGVEVETKRREEMKEWNPRFVLRQWVLEEIIKKVERTEADSRSELNHILKMASNPFLPYGREEDASDLALLDDSHLSAEEKEERRLCGLGPDEMLGFQCSCSS